MQGFCNLFPATHITSLIRNILLSGITESIDSSISGVDNGAFITAVKDTFSFNAHAFGTSFSGMNSVLYVGILALVCVAAMMVVYSKTYKK